jgi:uncharacterized protein YjbI with pentapeptide repeats
MMNITTQEQIAKVVLSESKVFRGMKLPDGDFTNLDLRNADFRGCSLPCAIFKGCNLTYATFENANLYGADFTDAVCHRVSFKDANLSNTKMFCKDMYGCTFTMECKSFQGMQISQGWWAGWLYYGLLMVPPSDEHRDKLIQAIGIERWEVLRNQYATRRM